MFVRIFSRFSNEFWDLRWWSGRDRGAERGMMYGIVCQM
jgi:hypothetical protein